MNLEPRLAQVNGKHLVGLDWGNKKEPTTKARKKKEKKKRAPQSTCSWAPHCPVLLDSCLLRPVFFCFAFKWPQTQSISFFFFLRKLKAFLDTNNRSIFKLRSSLKGYKKSQVSNCCFELNLLEKRCLCLSEWLWNSSGKSLESYEKKKIKAIFSTRHEGNQFNEYPQVFFSAIQKIRKTSFGFTLLPAASNLLHFFSVSLAGHFIHHKSCFPVFMVLHFKKKTNDFHKQS